MAIGIDSPLGKLLTIVAAVAIFGTLLATGVIKTGPKPVDACGGCGEGWVCVSEVSVETGPRRALKGITTSSPSCRQSCDVLRPACPAGEVCSTVTGGGACFPK